MNVLIAPDKFKEALDAGAVAQALADGVRLAIPDAVIQLCPLADGGEGTGAILARAIGAQTRLARVPDPLGRPIDAAWWFQPLHAIAIVESAQVVGFGLLAEAERNPLKTSTYGVGLLMTEAARAGAGRILLSVGGSTTVDGGAGCLQGLGWRLLDPGGATIEQPAHGGMLESIAGLHQPDHALGISIDILCDVDNPLLGPRGAAPVFAPQKGASDRQVRELQCSLEHWGALLNAARMPLPPLDWNSLPGTGAAGGLPAALAGVCGATLCSGIEKISELVRLPEMCARADVILTGEGRLDEQTLGGKVVAGVARVAREANRSVTAFVGRAAVGRLGTLDRLKQAVGVTEIVEISSADEPTAVAISETPARLRAAARDWAQRRMNGTTANRPL